MSLPAEHLSLCSSVRSSLIQSVDYGQAVCCLSACMCGLCSVGSSLSLLGMLGPIQIFALRFWFLFNKFSHKSWPLGIGPIAPGTSHWQLR